MKRILGFLAALSLVVACGGTTLAVAENSATDPDAGETDAGGTTSSKTKSPDGGATCCPIDDTPGCCMKYGGTRKGADSCLAMCDGMPDPKEPGWRRVNDSNGCDVWDFSSSTGTIYPLCGHLTTSECNPPCSTNEICVRDQVEGGAIFLPDDAGGCPSGRHLENGQCKYDPTYQCMPRPSACNSYVSCGCADTLCKAQNGCPYGCEGTTQNQVDCLCLVP